MGQLDLSFCCWRLLDIRCLAVFLLGTEEKRLPLAVLDRPAVFFFDRTQLFSLVFFDRTQLFSRVFFIVPNYSTPTAFSMIFGLEMSVSEPD